MQPLLVTAHLRHGYLENDPWSPSLDGILAYWLLREQLPEEAFVEGAAGYGPLIEADLSAVLAREEDGEGHWWWCCSSPRHVGPVVRGFIWFHRRFDAGEAVDRVDPAVRRVETKGGAYKNYRQRRTFVTTLALQWHAIGNPDQIRRLLRRCTHVGHMAGAGFGEVVRWEVTGEGADARLARLHRPVPAAYAVAHGVDGMVLDWGIRPPGRRPEHRALCVMPGG